MKDELSVWQLLTWCGPLGSVRLTSSSCASLCLGMWGTWEFSFLWSGVRISVARQKNAEMKVWISVAIWFWFNRLWVKRICLPWCWGDSFIKELFHYEAELLSNARCQTSQGERAFTTGGWIWSCRCLQSSARGIDMQGLYIKKGLAIWIKN